MGDAGGERHRQERTIPFITSVSLAAARSPAGPYSSNSYARLLLAKVMTCPLTQVRLHSTRYMRLLLHRAIPDFAEWSIDLLVTQLRDPDPAVALAALRVLEEVRAKREGRAGEPMKLGRAKMEANDKSQRTDRCGANALRQNNCRVLDSVGTLCCLGLPAPPKGLIARPAIGSSVSPRLQACEAPLYIETLVSKRPVLSNLGRAGTLLLMRSPFAPSPA